MTATMTAVRAQATVAPMRPPKKEPAARAPPPSRMSTTRRPRRWCRAVAARDQVGCGQKSRGRLCEIHVKIPFVSSEMKARAPRQRGPGRYQRRGCREPDGSDKRCAAGDNDDADHSRETPVCARFIGGSLRGLSRRGRCGGYDGGELGALGQQGCIVETRDAPTAAGDGQHDRVVQLQRRELAGDGVDGGQHVQGGAVGGHVVIGAVWLATSLVTWAER